MVRVRSEPENNYKAFFTSSGNTLHTKYVGSEPYKELEYPELYDVGLNSLCRGGCRYCFLPESNVSTQTGKKHIENISVGDLVACVATDGNIVYRTVSQCHMREVSENIIVISLESGNIIRVTENHKMMTENRGWVMAKDLTEKDTLFDIGFDVS